LFPAVDGDLRPQVREGERRAVHRASFYARRATPAMGT
jgi:hypothetical protein